MTIRPLIGFAVFGLFALVACQEEQVGAPCTPESDDRQFKPQIGVTDLVEPRNVQCETRTCITRSYWDGETADKYSFCSCKCKNADGSNADKPEDLCECPPNTVCETVDFPIDAAEKVRGYYCIPKCIAEGCDPQTEQQCTASNNSDEPWAWKCKTPKT